MGRDVAGFPLWVWVVGAGGVVAAYLYFKHTQSSSSASASGNASPGGQYKSTSSVKENITSTQAPPDPKKKKTK